MNGKLLLAGLAKMISGLVLMGLLLFLPAGTWQYRNAWILLAILFLPMLLVGTVLFLRNPELLEKRLHSKESDKSQAHVVLLSSILFVASFVTAGLDYRFGWSHVPVWLTALAVLLFVISYVLYAEVMRENAYLSRTVEIQEHQTVVDTGLYGIVRHPMYFATVLMFWSMPLVLGSWPAFCIMLLYPFVLVRRIQNEEQLLAEGLDGYTAYMKKVRYRLIPFVW